MKSAAARSEKRSFKQLAIDHAEKAVLALVVLFVLLAVSPVMTVWSRYTRTPEEMADLANESVDKVAHSIWPKDESEKYPLTDTIGDSVRKLRRPLDVSRFDYSGYGLMFALYPKRKPIKEPKFLAVEDPIATADRALIALQPEDDGSSSETGGGLGPVDGSVSAKGGKSSDSGQQGDESDVPDKYRRRGGRGSRLAGATGPGSTGSSRRFSILGGDDDDEEESYRFARLSLGSGSGSRFGAGRIATRRNARGMRFVTVRAVFPLKREIAEFRKALHAATDEEVADQVVLIDFEIERQMAVSRVNPWTGPWIKLDIQRAKDIIDEAEDFDPEVVTVGITDPVITMGLLRRVVGEWGDLATHPRVKGYQLNPEERREQERLNERTVDAWEKYLKDQPKPLRRRGFADRQRDLRGMASDLRRFGQGRYDAVLQQTATDFDPKTLRKQLKDNLGRQTASGRLLLFRYFDFDVEPGQTYRYRIRLELVNPNYGATVEQLQNPDSAKGQTRESAWSNPTPPTTVPRDTRYFLTRVTPPRGSGEPIANVDMYEWFPVFGTVANGMVGAHFGGFVSGLKKVRVLRPAQLTFDEEKDIPFFSSDMLVDISTGTRLRRTEHPDLQLPRAIRGGRGITTDQALILNPYGRFVRTNPVTDSSGREQSTKELGWQNDPWESLKVKEEAVVGQGDDDDDEDARLFGGRYSGSSAGATTRGAAGTSRRARGRTRGRRGRSRSSLRKRRAAVQRSSQSGAYAR